MLMLAAVALSACSGTSLSTANVSEERAERPARPATWIADNGNGTYTNPLFYEEFSDPDVIRVGEDYYLTGTTMHSMPGLPVLHSKDLVNWTLLSYCFDKLDLGPSFRLENNQEVYGQGIWAPCIRYNKGTFYIFSNVNDQGTHLFTATDPRGPWKHTRLGTTLYDLSVLFDDDGKIWAFHGINPIYISQMNDQVTDVVPNTRRVLIPQGSGMGEGLHAYKIKGKYYLVSAIPGAHTPMVCARADKLEGPWTVETLVTGEHMGVHTGYARGNGPGARGGRGRGGRGGAATDPAVAPATAPATPLPLWAAQPRDPNTNGGLTIHQGGIVDTPDGQWWSCIMQDHRSLGRVVCLAPITWVNDWPMLGLPGNPQKAPRSWIKPQTGNFLAPKPAPKPLFIRDDDFNAGKLNPIWQWSHVPVDNKWSLTEKAGVLRLHSLPAENFWWARNTLTQRAVGPESIVTVELDTAGMRNGDVAGLALANQPYAWIGVAKTSTGLELQEFDELTLKNPKQPLTTAKIWLRAHCNYDTEKANLFFSTDGRNFQKFGEEFTMLYQLKTFQGIRYSLFHYNTSGNPGGHADFDNFKVDEPRHATPLPPVHKTIILSSYADGSVLIARNGTLESVAASDPAANSPAAHFRVMDYGLGRVALQAVADNLFVRVRMNGQTPEITLGGGSVPPGGMLLQWVPMQHGDIQLMSHVNHRYLKAPKNAPGKITADTPITTPDHKDGSCFIYKVVD
jgi:beta-xylosidase